MEAKKEQVINAVESLYDGKLKQQSEIAALKIENSKLENQLAAQAIDHQNDLQHISHLEGDIARLQERKASASRSSQKKEKAKVASHSGIQQSLKSLWKLQRSIRERLLEFKNSHRCEKYNGEYLMQHRWHGCYFDRLKKLTKLQTEELDNLLAKCKERLVSSTHSRSRWKGHRHNGNGRNEGAGNGGHSQIRREKKHGLVRLDVFS